ncbi:hypothetical protein SNE40_006576 [Patella caerulea]|uniref:Tektin n=1 Tax=Patella caerulea TaxID=87958 RepID=A0AAN8JWT4_PATCE
MTYYGSLSARGSMTPEMSKMLPFVTDRTPARHLNRSLDLGHSKAYYNPASKSVYNRYSVGDWGYSNNTHYNLSDKERAHGERLRADAWRTIKETDARTRNRQNDVTKRLGERVYDIAYMKGELNTEINQMATEIENLKEYRRTLEKALGDTANPLHVAEECLMHREKRRGIDLVNDHVEKSLIKEVEIIKKCQNKMQHCLQKAMAQIKVDRAAQHSLEVDSKDKHHAQGLDDRMQQLRNSSGGIGYFPSIENVDNTITIPESWGRYTQQNIARSQKERAASARLRGEIDALLRACASEMWNIYNNVNTSFNTRIHETTDARNTLQAHLQRTVQEILDMERNIQQLRKAIQDKENPMKVAQTRLDERTRRINVEVCHDPVMKSLKNEVGEIRDSITMLKRSLKASEISLARLLKTKAVLEHDIGVKENSLKLDSKSCMGMRKGFPMDPKVGPVFQMVPGSY